MPILINKNLIREKISSILKKNKISDKDYGAWMRACAFLDGKELEKLSEILDGINVSKEFSFLNENIIKKFTAFSTNDKALIKKILDEEEQFLSKAAK